MDVIWAQYTLVSLLCMTEIEKVRQIDPAITTIG